jgi:hypothetical protein
MYREPDFIGLFSSLFRMLTGNVLAVPINPLADDLTPISSLIEGDYKISIVIKPSGSTAGWLPTAGQLNAANSLVPLDMSQVVYGAYDLGLQVTCQGASFISDTIKGVVDRSAPQVQTTSPLDGGAADSSQDISVEFDEPVDCKRTFAGVAVGDLPPQRTTIVCEGNKVKVIPSAAQVCISAFNGTGFVIDSHTCFV